MSFDRLQSTWDQLGQVDPLWAILTAPDKANGQWDVTAFFATGKAEIDHLLFEVKALNFPLRFARALDFGCGVGRLTQALSHYFDETHGVDIAPSMIELANQYNQKPQTCFYHVNQAPDLQLFGDNQFDFIYSRIVLQHMAPLYSKQYISEFLRLLKPGGLLVFQLPSSLIAATMPPEDRAGVTPSARFAADIMCNEEKLQLRQGQQYTLPVTVTNTSHSTWSAQPDSSAIVGFVQLGNHWLSRTNDMLQVDDGRTPLTTDLAPGEQIRLNLLVTAPPRPGRYILELDMVEEGVAWFQGYGSQTCRLPVIVSDSRPLWQQLVSYGRNLFDRVGSLVWSLFPGRQIAENHTETEEPLAFEMHGVPRQEVVETIIRNQGEIVTIQYDAAAGPTWNSYLYYVTKPESKSS
ncbi:MAG: class I SAM-dependent methyltransferase [Chloroflexota bacterium]